MKTIVFIGTQKSGSSREAIKAAERLGYYTVLLTNKTAHCEKRTEFPDVHLMQLCDINNIYAIRKVLSQLILKAIEIKAVVSFIDPYCHTASILAEELGINHFSSEAIGRMQNKFLSRQILSQTLYSPSFMSFTEDSPLSKEDVKKLLPAIVKSPMSSGSKDVFKVNSYTEFMKSVKKINERYPGEAILAEEFLDGPQYLTEVVVYGGEIHIIAVIAQEITLSNGRFIITGYNLMHDLAQDFFQNLKTAVKSIIEAHGMTFGTCHLELRLVKNHWKLIEVNPRISGGGMNKLIEIGLGINLVEETLKMLLSEKPQLQPRYKKYTFAQYVIISESGILSKVTGKTRAFRSPGVKAVYVKPRKGNLLTPPVSMGSRYAFVIADGNSEQEAIQNAKTAASQIQFHLLPPEDEKNDISAI